MFLKDMILKKKKNSRLEMAQQLRALAALPLGSVQSPHMVSQWNLASRRSNALFWPHEHFTHVGT